MEYNFVISNVYIPNMMVFYIISMNYANGLPVSSHFSSYLITKSHTCYSVHFQDNAIKNLKWGDQEATASNQPEICNQVEWEVNTAACLREGREVGFAIEGRMWVEGMSLCCACNGKLHNHSWILAALHFHYGNGLFRLGLFRIRYLIY